MLAHAEIIIRAPYRNITLTFRAMKGRAGKAACAAFEIHEYSIPTFLLQAGYAIPEKLLIIHVGTATRFGVLPLIGTGSLS